MKCSDLEEKEINDIESLVNYEDDLHLALQYFIYNNEDIVLLCRTRDGVNYVRREVIRCLGTPDNSYQNVLMYNRKCIRFCSLSNYWYDTKGIRCTVFPAQKFYGMNLYLYELEEEDRCNPAIELWKYLNIPLCNFVRHEYDRKGYCSAHLVQLYSNTRKERE